MGKVRDNGKENGNYRNCRGYIGFRVAQDPKEMLLAQAPPFLGSLGWILEICMTPSALNPGNYGPVADYGHAGFSYQH